MMQRIIIFGRPGSGKSTFSLWLHNATNLPLHHLDKHFYVRDWIERDYEAFLNIQQFLVNQDEWIIDGNNIRSLEMRYQRADMCLYFNYSRLTCLWRILKRRYSKNSHLFDRAEGCKEIIRWRFLVYMWCFKKRVDAQLKYLKAAYPHVTFVEIKNDKTLEQVKSFFSPHVNEQITFDTSPLAQPQQ